MCSKRSCLVPVPRTPGSVPTGGIVTIPLRRHVVLLGNLLLNAEFLVTLVLRFAADVSHTSALVLVDVEYLISPCHTLDVIGRKRVIDLLLSRRLWGADVEAGRGKL